MAIGTAALGLIGTAALLSMYKMPGYLSPRKSYSQMVQPQKRFTDPFLAHRQYYEPPPPRFSLENFVNRIFRRPHLADVRPPANQNARPYHVLPPSPIWHSDKAPLSLPSNAYYAYSQYGMPIVNTNLRHATSSLRPSSTKSPNKSTNPKEKHYSGEVDDRDDPDEHDDDYDDHYYSEDFNPFEGPFIEENDSKEQASKDYKEKKGNEYFYKERKEKSLADASDKSKKNSTEKYVANPSKNNFAYSKQKQTTTSTTQATVTRNCSPDSKVNYHYHMYMIKKVAGEQKKQKKGTMKKHTMPTSVHPVYQSLNSDASSQSLHQLQAPAPSSSHDLLVYDSQAEKAPSAFSYEQGKDDSLSDFYYQVVTSSSYIEPPGSYLQASPNGAHKSATPQAVSHFDSDYYNNVLISKILGMNQMQKVMPLENYATERNGVAPLVTYEKLKNSKPVEFEYDENSKLYVTPGKGKSSEATKKKPPKGKH